MMRTGLTTMVWGLLAIALGLVLGGGTGYLAGLTRVHSAWQSAAVGPIAMWLTALAMPGIAILRERAAGFAVFNVSGIRFRASVGDIARLTLGLAVGLAVFGALHLLLARFGPPRLTPFLPVVVGCIGSVVVSVPFAWVMSHVRF
jgi:hypothetical protein